ncbi:hypothetical protein PFISCL1PPCAC_8576 [Pristionchus fissidentatus]|uniref:Methyltransferase n=1 Tax=Pristionchus fissidentatus TaxID=1538716 RepID=A0AAV5VFR3_9BILA|nr:hypothetical protein PFISCL1PPCAC_8576 [Pristionchus fissidentatus]
MPSTVEKSYESSDKLIVYTSKVSKYCIIAISYNRFEKYCLNPSITYRIPGAPEELEMGKAMIHLTRARKVLDIGTFTGASALAWSLELPADGKVISMDVTHESLNKAGLPILDAHPELRKKIDFKLGSAVDKLKSLVASGASGSFGFAFIDADKGNYSVYYDLCMELLAPGGALWDGEVVEPKDDSSKAIDAVNRKAAADSRVFNTLFNIGDGVHLIVKKH